MAGAKNALTPGKSVFRNIPEGNHTTEAKHDLKASSAALSVEAKTVNRRLQTELHTGLKK